MRFADIGENPRIAMTLDLLQAIAAAKTPSELLARFGPKFWQLRRWDALVSVSRRGLGEGEYKITRLVRAEDVSAEDGVRRLEQINPWKRWDSLPVHTGGFVGRMIADPLPKLVRELAIRNDPALGDRVADMRSCIAIPKVEQGEPIYWTITFSRREDRFDLHSLEDVILTSNLVGTMTGHLAALNTINELNERLRAQLESVARVQQSLLPTMVPTIPGLLIATSYLPSEEAGGDYYDFFDLGDGRWGVLIADVSGHGPAATTIMAMLHAILHAYIGDMGDPGAVMAHANERLCHARLDGSFITAFFAVYDPRTHEMRFTRCGHNPPRLKLGETGKIVAIEEAAGLPLGVMADASMPVGTMRLGPLDTLVLYTDGVIEERDASGRMFGVDGLDRALLKCSGVPECVVDSIHAALYEHTRRRTRVDDQTLVAIRRLS